MLSRQSLLFSNSQTHEVFPLNSWQYRENDSTYDNTGKMTLHLWAGCQPDTSGRVVSVQSGLIQNVWAETEILLGGVFVIKYCYAGNTSLDPWYVNKEKIHLYQTSTDLLSRGRVCMVWWHWPPPASCWLWTIPSFFSDCDSPHPLPQVSAS